MEKITIEKVEQVIERYPYLSYKEAKEVLEKNDGNVLDAIIFLEESKAEKSKHRVEEFETKFTEETEKIRLQLIELLKGASIVRIVVEKNEKTVLNIPLSIGVVGVAATPLLALLGISAVVLSSYTAKIIDEDSGEEVDLGELTPEKIEILKGIILNSFENIMNILHNKASNKPSNDSDIDITDDLLNENSSEEESNDNKDESTTE
ncbi:DUF4342 domain-containing protein [Peptostreptococcus faecalis]|uniref:DUF4342 domain-containing protein n=1 Tax=Peptostreptococcus faecalis TaxID=2045015 RepID=UPI000C79F82C|nr:DUF4342 domain-containing protein [Peptostreptococcus faecalis]